MPVFRRSRFAALALVSGVVLAGCQAPVEDEPAETEAVDQAEVEEGSVEAVESEPVSDGFFLLYSGRSETLIQPLIDQFTEETGIEVRVRYGNTGEMAALLLEEGERTDAGVFLSQDAGALGAVAKAGLFHPLPPEIAEQIPQGFTSTDGSWVGVTGRARVVVYNSEQVSEDQLPETADELVTSQWTSQLGVAPTNASFQSFVTAYRVIEGEGAAEAWVAALVTNSAQKFDNNTSILEAVEAGTIPLGLINHYYWYRLAAERGEENLASRLWFTEPGDPASIVNVTGAGILTPAQLDQDAIDFVQYLISESAQQYFVETTYEYPLLPGVAAPEDLPELESLLNPNLDLSDLDSLAETTSLLTRFGLL